MRRSLPFLLFVFPLAVAAADLPAPSTDFYVADYAEVLSEETESEIVVENDALYRETGAQIVIVTMETLDGADIADFTYDLFAEWGLGRRRRTTVFYWCWPLRRTIIMRFKAWDCPSGFPIRRLAIC